MEDGHHVGPTIAVEDYTFSTISRTGHRVVAATRHGILLFDGHTGERLGTIPANDLRSAFITIADQLFVGSLGGELVQYDLDTLAPIRSFGGSRGAIQEVYGTTDGPMIAARGGDGDVSLFDAATGTRIGPPFTANPDDQLVMSLAMDGTTLAYGGGLRSGIKVVDLAPDALIEASCRNGLRRRLRQRLDRSHRRCQQLGEELAVAYDGVLLPDGRSGRLDFTTRSTTGPPHHP